jgi:4-diphosphocytidyl-2-C-methyl-D-erythritol kinase
MSDDVDLQALLKGIVNPGGDTIRIAAPAKINLFLKVTGKRNDGYHDIYTWFQAIDLCDILEITRIPHGEMTVAVTGADLPSGPDNLVFRSADQLRKKFGLAGGLEIKLEKKIPVGAGLGGGSSDAAACMKAVNRLFALGMDNRQLMAEGAKIGSDVPFFFSPGQAEVTGRGEIVMPITLPIDYEILLAMQPFQISAREAYERVKIDLTAGNYRRNFDGCQSVEQLIDIIHGVPNDLETALLQSHSELSYVRKKLVGAGARLVRMSGSGPTMFAIFDHTSRGSIGGRAAALSGVATRLVQPTIIPV